ncbi:major tail protein [Enterococcus sp. AZ103]|uniref:major tail protein n=1 Tax=Enterococcus sp. AZ103 TaxID=2774628 RepID=UPI003F267BE5
MTLVGFKQATIQILDEDLKPVVDKKFVVKGETNKGATSGFEITGLSPEAVKVYGSNAPYYVSQQGTGEVEATFSALDLPSKIEHEVLGRTSGTNGVFHVGEKTVAPYCAILFESADLRGQKIGTGLYAGKFSRDAVSAETLNGDSYEPEADEYKFTPIAKVIDSENQTVGFADSDSSFVALETELFGTTTEGGNG